MPFGDERISLHRALVRSGLMQGAVPWLLAEAGFGWTCPVAARCRFEFPVHCLGRSNANRSDSDVDLSERRRLTARISIVPVLDGSRDASLG